MTVYTRLTALSIARAMLCGPQEAGGLVARIEACLGGTAPWCHQLAQRCARLPGEQWRRLTPRTLANLVERDEGYESACHARPPPCVRRYLLHWPQRMQAPPLGLDRVQRPDWRTARRWRSGWACRPVACGA